LLLRFACVDTVGVVQVRRAVPADAMAVAGVHVRSWQSGYRGLVAQDYLDALRPEDRARRYTFDSANPDGPVTLVAVDGGLVCGFVTVGRSRDDDLPDAGEIWALYVDPQRWGRGVGQTLMSDGIAWLRRSGHAVAALWVLSTNARARRFYENGGWERDGSERLDCVGGRSIPHVRYRRTI
jgi:GNAT superfamily N-acetyltransferase